MKAFMSDNIKLEVGDRIGTISHSEEDTIYTYGFGVYLGEETPTEGVTFLGVPVKIPVPKFKMDSGEILYGCECSWDTEADTKKIIRDFEKKKELSITSQREFYKKNPLDLASACNCTD